MCGILGIYGDKEDLYNKCTKEGYIKKKSIKLRKNLLINHFL